MAEQIDGLIVDHQLIRETSPGDPALLRESLDRLDLMLDTESISGVSGDRGFDSPVTRERLDALSVFNAVASRSVPKLVEQMSNPDFRAMRKRRAQTEGRIGILKNCFLGSPMRQKGFDQRERHVSLSVLSHNLWLLSRLQSASGPLLESSA